MPDCEQDFIARTMQRLAGELSAEPGPSAAAMWWRLNLRMRQERARRAQAPLIWMTRILYLAIALLAAFLVTLMTQLSGPVVTTGLVAFGVLTIPAGIALWGWARSGF